MALGRRKRVQDELFIAHDRLPVGPGNSFYIEAKIRVSFRLGNGSGGPVVDYVSSWSFGVQSL